MSDPHSSQNKKITHGLSRLVKGLPSIFEHADYSKEVGILLITIWFHATSRLLEKKKSLKSIPPVLMSTVTALLGLNILHGILGQQTLNKILKYFDPSVNFLGNWYVIFSRPYLLKLLYRLCLEYCI